MLKVFRVAELVMLFSIGNTDGFIQKKQGPRQQKILDVGVPAILKNHGLITENTHESGVQLYVPIEIKVVESKHLHNVWSFLEHGLIDICRKTKPDWHPCDLYVALRAEAATACLISRNSRLLGFIVWHRQERVFSHILDVFVWAAWALPLRERLPDDNIAEAISRGYEYLFGVKKAIGASRIIMISPRKGFQRKYGFKPLFMTYEVG